MLVKASFCAFADTALGTEMPVSVLTAWHCIHAFVKNGPYAFLSGIDVEFSTFHFLLRRKVLHFKAV